MDDNKPTCGPLFLQCVERFAAATDDRVRLISAGHALGQAEKVCLGACPAFMVRPSREYRSWALWVASVLSEVYGLDVSVFDRPDIADEIWMHRHGAQNLVGCLSQMKANTPEWHEYRGFLCGVPDKEIDERFHERRGYRERCEPETGSFCDAVEAEDRDSDGFV